MRTAKVVIIGSGFAGAATAWQLAARGLSDVLVLERDPAPGQRASGRNAGMIRTLFADPAVQRLAVESARIIADPPPGLPAEGAFDRIGSLILAGPDQAGPLAAAAARARRLDRTVVEVEGLPEEIARWLAGVRYASAFATPDDGVADVHALLGAYLDAARSGGMVLRTGAEVREILVEGGRAAGVRTDSGEIRARTVVNAAGAFAGLVGARGAADRIRIGPRRRHLHSTGPLAGPTADLPFVWHLGDGFYFRPESGGFLLSGCDETPAPPGDPATDPSEEERLAAKLSSRAPALADLPVRSRWACLRTFSADDRPVIGWDPVLPGLFWVAALGGHGVTTSAAVGRLAAEAILAGPGAEAGPLGPARFA